MNKHDGKNKVDAKLKGSLLVSVEPTKTARDRNAAVAAASDPGGADLND